MSDEPARGGELPSASSPPPSAPPFEPPAPPATNAGPDGAHLERADGVALDIPEGALEEPIFVTIGAPSSSALVVAGTSLVPIVRLEPAGTTFLKAVELSMPAPKRANGAEYRADEIVVLGASADSPALEEVFFTIEDGRLRAVLHHFSDYGVYEVDPGEKTVREVKVCATYEVRGLTRQILGELLQLSPGALVPARVDCADPMGVHAQPAVATAIESAVSIGQDPHRPFILESAWRSLAQQYVLEGNCGGSGAVAAPGASRHVEGLAIDVKTSYGDWASSKCADDVARVTRTTGSAPSSRATRDRAHPKWGERLEATRRFEWWGTSHGSVCEDPPHFDYVFVPPDPPPRDLRTVAVLAFQRLWNRYNPCDPIPVEELGKFAPDEIQETLTRLSVSPAAGFQGEPPEPGCCVGAVPGAGDAGQRCMPQRFCACRGGLMGRSYLVCSGPDEGRCVVCGFPGQPCCEGDHPCREGANMICQDGLCVGCGSWLGGPCCADGSCGGYAVCENGRCIAPGQPAACATTSSCCGGSASCTQICQDGFCRQCGEPGGPCCSSGSRCRDGALCENGRCVAVGGPGEPCTQAGTCDPGLVCTESHHCVEP